MVYRNELKVEWAELLNLTLLDGVRERSDAMLFEFCLNQCQRELRTHQWDVFAHRQKVRNATDVVLVTVSEDCTDNSIQLVLEVAKVRQNQINTGLSFLREQHAAVQNHDLTVEFEHGHVATNFANSA